MTRGGICVPPTVTYVSGSSLTAVGRSQLLARWPGTRSRISPGIQRAAQTVLGVYLKRTCSHDTSASSALGVLNDYALYKSTHSLTRSENSLGLHVSDVVRFDAGPPSLRLARLPLPSGLTFDSFRQSMRTHLFGDRSAW